MEKKNHSTQKKEHAWSKGEFSASLHCIQICLNEVMWKFTPSPFKKEGGPPN